MKEFLTAEQAYELAASWQETKVLEAVEYTLEKIEETARKGIFYTKIYNPFLGTFLDRNSYIQKMKSLGYIYDGSDGEYTFWKWDKRKD